MIWAAIKRLLELLSYFSYFLRAHGLHEFESVERCYGIWSYPRHRSISSTYANIKIKSNFKLTEIKTDWTVKDGNTAFKYV